MQPETGPAPELVAAMAETRVYRDLLAEVLASFAEPPWSPARRSSVVTRSQYREWLARAGMKEAG